MLVEKGHHAFHQALIGLAAEGVRGVLVQVQLDIFAERLHAGRQFL